MKEDAEMSDYKRTPEELFYLNCLCVGVEACYIEDVFLIS